MSRSGILIISHTFPPSPGIGGRRWAKFAKYLHRKQLPLQVLSAFSEKQGSLWADDVKGIHQRYWMHTFPEVLSHDPASLYAKLKYRAALFKNKISGSGNPYDRSLYDQKAFTAALETELRDPNLATVVLTGPPFGLLRYAISQMEKYPGLFWMADLRDPWTSGMNYGYSALKGTRAIYESNAEREVLQKYHAVTTPWPLLATELRLKYPGEAHKIHLLPHAFDRDDVGQRSAAAQNEVPHIAYGGNTYSGFDAVFSKLHEMATHNKIVVEIYSANQPTMAVKKSVDGFIWRNPVAPREFYREARKADFLLFLIPEAVRNGLPTKLYEYAAMGIPLLAVGFKGTLQELLEREGLGAFIELNNFGVEIATVLSAFNRHTAVSNWVDKYEISRVAEILLGIIERGKL